MLCVHKDKGGDNWTEGNHQVWRNAPTEAGLSRPIREVAPWDFEKLGIVTGGGGKGITNMATVITPFRPRIDWHVRRGGSVFPYAYNMWRVSPIPIKVRTKPSLDSFHCLRQCFGFRNTGKSPPALQIFCHDCTDAHLDQTHLSWSKSTADPWGVWVRSVYPYKDVSLRNGAITSATCSYRFTAQWCYKRRRGFLPRAHPHY